MQTYCAEDPGALVFTEPLSEGLRRRYTAWDRARRQAGWRRSIFTTSAHAAGTLAAQTGATTRELMARLGHASPAASQRYQHAATRRNRRVADAVEDVIGHLLSGPPQPGEEDDEAGNGLADKRVRTQTGRGHNAATAQRRGLRTRIRGPENDP